jgi:hypothetical protein
MENKKQTAVEWLIDELLNGKILIPSLIEQAKQMEKRQHQQIATHFFPTSLKKKDFEEYITKAITNEKANNSSRVVRNGNSKT